MLDQSLSDEINKVAKIIKQGGVVIFPTDTVYGIGCIFDNQKAIERIHKIKGTPKSQPFPILVSSIKQVKALAAIPDIAQGLMQKYWPGGLTVILPGLSTYSNPGLKQLDKPGLDRVKIGFRLPDSDLIRSLIEKVGKPIIGTSANLHSVKASTSYAELDPVIIKLSDYVIKGKCQGGTESTVVDATGNEIRIIRQGAIKL